MPQEVGLMTWNGTGWDNVKPAPFTVTAITSATGTGTITTSSDCNYNGFSLAVTSGSGATKVNIRMASTTAGTILDVVTLVTGESAREFYPFGIPSTSGIYYEVVTGSVEGSIRHG